MCNTKALPSAQTIFRATRVPEIKPHARFARGLQCAGALMLLALLPACATSHKTEAIDRTAPVVEETSIDIAASPEATWKVLTDVSRWPTWNDSIKASALEGALRTGSTIAWKTGELGLNMDICSRLTVVEPGRAFAWAGRSDELTALHSWRLEPIQGGTRVYNEESFRGAIAEKQADFLRPRVEVFLQHWNTTLKSAVEKTATE